MQSHRQALESWVRIMAAPTQSAEPTDRKLAGEIKQYVNQMPFAIDFARSVRRQVPAQRELPGMREVMMPQVARSEPGRDIER